MSDRDSFQRKWSYTWRLDWRLTLYNLCQRTHKQTQRQCCGRWKWRADRGVGCDVISLIGSALHRLLEARQTTPANWIPLTKHPKDGHLHGPSLVMLSCECITFTHHLLPWCRCNNDPTAYARLAKHSYFLSETDGLCKKLRPLGF